MADLLRSMWCDDGGQDLVEYALIVLLVAIALVTALRTLGSAISASLSASAAKI